MNKKEVERRILELVYDVEKYERIIESERPDFVIKNFGINSYFGIEITEFYLSASNARLKRNPNYLSEIIDNGQYRHKDDKKALEVTEIELIASDGTSIGKEKGIFQELPQPYEYCEMIIRTIAAKEQKLIGYANDLTHVNLIVLDADCMLHPSSLVNLYKSLNVAKLSKMLFETKFREIYLIIKINNKRLVYLPLKMLSLITYSSLFVELISGIQLGKRPQNDNNIDCSSKILLDLFSHFMRAKTSHILLSSESEREQVIFGNFGLFFGETGICILDHADYPLPSNAQFIDENEITEYFKSNEFLKKEKEYLDKHVLSINLAIDVRANWEFWELSNVL